MISSIHTCSKCSCTAYTLYTGHLCEDCYIDNLADTHYTTRPSYSNKGLTSDEQPELIYEEYLAAHLPPKHSKPLMNDAGELKQSVSETLLQRETRYGSFSNHSELSQKLKHLVGDHIINHGQAIAFTSSMKEALEMILHKIARIANGDPAYDDSWRDIAGYSQLIVDELTRKELDEA